MSLLSTSLAQTSNAAINIGETVTYSVTITVPEGVTSLSLDITPGLGIAFLDASITSVATNLAVSAQETQAAASLVHFNFGEVTNSPAVGSDAIVVQVITDRVCQPLGSRYVVPHVCRGSCAASRWSVDLGHAVCGLRRRPNQRSRLHCHDISCDSEPGCHNTYPLGSTWDL